MNKSVQLAIENFSFLETDYGFYKPKITEDTFITTLSYLGKEIGVDIELDFRDLYVFILFVKLNNGNLPKGYYVEDGKKVRVHFEKIIKDNNVINNKKIINQEEFEKLILLRSDSLNKQMKKIISFGKEIFD